MSKSKTFDALRRFASQMMPRRWQNAILSWILRTRYKPPTLVFPWNKSAIKKALVILPEDPIEAFHQINNYLQIASFYQNATFSLLCIEKIGALFKHVHPEAFIYEYEPSQRFLFSRQLSALGASFSKEEFDMSVILEHTPDISMLFLVGKTAARIRAGYTEAGEFPFLNMHVNLSKKQRYRAEQNSVMARVLGATGSIKMQWSVSKETLEEISHMLYELHLSPSSRLIGVDVDCFYKVFGPDWIEMLCRRLREKDVSFYLYTQGEPDGTIPQFLSEMGSPVFSNLSAPRCAALIMRSVGVISGKSIFFELANMLGKPAVGVFEEKERAVYCRESVFTKAVSYSTTSDRSIIEKVIALADAQENMRKA
jgi:hypothetical protein